MKLTLQPTEEFPSDFVTVEISKYDDHMNLPVILDELIKPALVAWGFHPDTVEKIVIEDQ
jgi:hypothetical protein